MVRNYKKKRDREVDEDDMDNAINKVIRGHMKLRQATDAYSINLIHCKFFSFAVLLWHYVILL